MGQNGVSASRTGSGNENFGVNLALTRPSVTRNLEIFILYFLSQQAILGMTDASNTTLLLILQRQPPFSNGGFVIFGVRL